MQKKELYVIAYPKSGITFLIYLLCDMLDSPQQNLPDEEFLWHGPGREGNFIIIKRHEWYQPDKHDGKTIVFLQRDPRDVVISAWFYRGGPKTISLVDSIKTMWTTIPPYDEYVGSWKSLELDMMNVYRIRYEDLIQYPVGCLLLHYLLMTGSTDDTRKLEEKIKAVLERQSFSNMQKKIDTHFVRKGIVGDWKNYFTREIAKEFNEHLGEFMLEQGYVDNLDWWKDIK